MTPISQAEAAFKHVGKYTLAIICSQIFLCETGKIYLKVITKVHWKYTKVYYTMLSTSLVFLEPVWLLKKMTAHHKGNHMGWDLYSRASSGNSEYKEEASPWDPVVTKQATNMPGGKQL